MNIILEDRTPEQVRQSITAAFDSVNLINQIILQTATERIKKLVTRNESHLSLMLTKNWFAEGLTPTEKVEIESCIAAAKAFVAQ